MTIRSSPTPCSSPRGWSGPRPCAGPPPGWRDRPSLGPQCRRRCRGPPRSGPGPGPGVVFTALSKWSNFNGMSPWSWYMATTAWNSPLAARTKTVSAGSGPVTSRPRSRHSRMAGAMISWSSWPNRPSSPAWGFSPHTAMRGPSRPSRLSRSAVSSATRTILWKLIFWGTSRRGKWVVTNVTLILGPARHMTGSALLLSSARSSVWPGYLCPARCRLDLARGAVVTAWAWPALISSTAVTTALYAASPQFRPVVAEAVPVHVHAGAGHQVDGPGPVKPLGRFVDDVYLGRGVQ